MNQLRKLAAFLLLLLLLLGTLPALAQKQLTLSFLGDCTIGNEEWLKGYEDSFAQTAKREGYAYFFQNVASLLAQDDLTIANFEGALKNHDSYQARKTYCFRGLPEYAQILSLGSVEAVSLDNNHTMDYGTPGFRSTRQALQDAGIAFFDLKNPYLFEKDGLRVGVLGVHLVGYHGKREVMAEAVRSLREQGANAVVALIHGGLEYAALHDDIQAKAAHFLVNAGADLVVGSHPHVLQGVEVYKGRAILYSLGNFVFGGNRKVRALETAVARVTLTFDDSGVFAGQQLRLYPANVSGHPEKNDYRPVLVTGEAAEAVYARVDADSAGDWPVVNQTDAWRDYAYLAAEDIQVDQK